MLTLSHLSGFNAFTPPPSGPPPSSYIKSIQPFEITIGTSATSNTAAISNVTTGNSVIFFAGFATTHTGTTLREILSRVELTNGTTVTAYRDTSSASFTVTVRGTVVEFESAAISSVQQGTVTIASGSTSGTATISSVTTSRSAVFYLGLTNSTSATGANVAFSRVELTNATTVTATRNTSSTAVITLGYAVVEFASSITSSVQAHSFTSTANTLSHTDTITSVNTGRAMILYNGVTSGTSTMSNFMYNLTLTDAATVTLSRAATGTTTRTVNYTVVEFASGVVNSLSRGTTAVASATSADTSISSVATSKAVCNMQNFSSDGSGYNDRMATAKLNSATSVRGEKNTAGSSTSTVGWEVVEFL